MRTRWRLGGSADGAPARPDRLVGFCEGAPLRANRVQATTEPLCRTALPQVPGPGAARDRVHAAGAAAAGLALQDVTAPARRLPLYHLPVLLHNQRRKQIGGSAARPCMLALLSLS